MDVRTVGVEEELLLVDPETRKGVPRSQQVLKHAAEHQLSAHTDVLDHELFRHQLETRTPPVTDLAALRDHLVEARRLAAEAAGGAGLRTVASGTLPLPSGEPKPTRDDRYLDMIETYGEIARPGGTCGMHVHAHVDSDEEGVAVIDALVPWLPVLLAISANSPFAEGRDTHYASWRSQVWSRWPSAGPTERFGSLERYREVSRRMIESGAARDDGMLYFDARLSREHPTVEVRVSDVCTDADDAVLIAALVRALVSHAAAEGSDTGVWRSELLRAAQWRAARFGLSDRLLDPTTGDLLPARDVLDLMLRTVGDHLAAAGDADLVRDGLSRVLGEGGAARQRAAYERSGGRLEAVVDDLVARTNGQT
ncbi:carboxylate-amine ligase [Nocardioides sp. SYSU DS0651]|uniref:carboxylate-amine ligase n=1 Tax=Nocardioides sp. SYSU DS0651 TaxID=3415955 RepID=UPI003F4BD42A